jgi:hypothetical protein
VKAHTMQRRKFIANVAAAGVFLTAPQHTRAATPTPGSEGVDMHGAAA